LALLGPLNEFCKNEIRAVSLGPKRLEVEVEWRMEKDDVEEGKDWWCWWING
jgi:hypothetical protein